MCDGVTIARLCASPTVAVTKEMLSAGVVRHLATLVEREGEAVVGAALQTLNSLAETGEWVGGWVDEWGEWMSGWVCGWGEWVCVWVGVWVCVWVGGCVGEWVGV